MDRDVIDGRTILNPLNETVGSGANSFWSRTCRIIAECFRLSARDQAAPKDEEMLQRAHRELQEAHNCFSSVDDPELIDYAIYSLKAAEIRYNFLFQKIKQQRITRC